MVKMRLHWRAFLFSSVLFFLTTVHSSNWQENIRPKLFAKLTSRDFQSFSGSLKTKTQQNLNGSQNAAGNEEDFFTMMLYTHMTDEALVVGARNILYKLSVDELRLRYNNLLRMFEKDTKV